MITATRPTSQSRRPAPRAGRRLEITQPELALLNFYRASELHGGLLLGQMARRETEPKLIRNLTAHSAEELVHAQLWTQTIHALGGAPWPVRDTYQARYAAAVGIPRTTLDLLSLTHVFEKRVHRHFTAHLARPGTHPLVRRTLRRLVADERDHLLWVRRWLTAQASGQGSLVRDTLQRYAEADEVIYAQLLRDYGFGEAA